MTGFDDIRAKAEKLAADHPDQAEKISDEAIERGGDAADKLTGDRYEEQVDRAQGNADDALGE